MSKSKKRRNSGDSLERCHAEIQSTAPVFQTETNTQSSEKWWTRLSAFATVFATVFAGWAAWESHRSAVETARSAKISAWMPILTDYGSKDMLVAMKSLRLYQIRYQTNFADRFSRGLLNTNVNDPEYLEAAEIDQNRRIVAHFFSRVRQMVDGEIVEPDVIRRYWSAGTYTYLHQVLFPLERAKSEAQLKMGAVSQDDYDKIQKQQVEHEEFFGRILDH